MNQEQQMHGTARVRHSHHLRLGDFGELFPNLQTWAFDFGADRSQVTKIMALLGGSDGIMHDVKNNSGNSSIPAAYTFLAQFVDHDITLDAESELENQPLSPTEIQNLPNLRSASLDLDSVYGFGPDISPYLYDPGRPGFLLTGSNVNGVGNPNDVPRRADGVALIGDFRNDENLFLSQMHLLFLRFHNRRVIDLSIGRSGGGQLRFEDVQRNVRYHYQYIVLHDLLKRVCNEAVYNFALEQIKANARLASKDRSYPFYRDVLIDRSDRIRMPVEFSGAAYRFGHTMVRSHYPVNQNYPMIEIFDERLRTTGFRQPAPQLAVDWQFLLNVEEHQPYVFSKAMDHLLANELINLPIPVVPAGSPKNEHSLAFRNLLRGYVFGLPSGQRVAQALGDAGYTTINPETNLFENTEDIDGWSTITDDNTRSRLEKHTPLFFYLMREASVLERGQRLGPVGSAILMEVFGAMFVHQQTFLNDSDLGDSDWEPDRSVTRGENLTLASLVRYVSS